MIITRFFVFALLASIVISCNTNTDGSAQSATIADPEEKETIADAVSRVTVWETAPNPESVAIGRGVIYATHFGDKLEPMVQDGDGYIASYDANGGFIEKVVTGLDAPKGMEVLNNQLFVVDVDSLLGFSTKDGSRTFTASFTGKAQFLNGLAARDEGNLYVSATDAGKIWLVDITSGVTTEVANIPNVNGIAVASDGSVIFAVQYNGQDPTAGRLLAVNPVDGSSVPLGSYTGMLDGVVTYKGAVYFTDWNPSGMGKVLRYDLKTFETTVVLEDERLQGPADFEVLGDGLAIIPMLTGSRILGVRLNEE